MKKIIQLCVLSLLALFLFTSLSIAGEADKYRDNRNLYMTKFCITCHGQQGVAVAPNYPNLAKQNKLYLIKQINDIINKKRTTKLTVLMTEHPVINSIHEQEIVDIADYMTNIR